MARRIWLIAAALIAVIAGAVPAYAQTRQIEYGTFTIASLDQNVQGGFFTFNANAGDFMIVEAVALSGSLDPRVTLLNAASTTLAVNSNDPFQPAIGDARLSYRLPETSSYTLLVEAENGTEGQYLLRLERAELPSASSLGVNVITTANVSAEVPTQVYTFDSASGDTVSVRGATTGFDYAAEVYNPDGQMLTVTGGAGLASGAVTVPADSGVYTLVVRNATAAGGGSVEVEFSGGAAAPSPDVAEVPDEEGETGDEETAEVPSDDTETADAEDTDTADDGDEETAEVPTTDETTVDADTSTDADAAAGTDEGDADAETETDAEGNVGAEAVGSGFPTNRCNVTPSDGGVVIRQGPDTDFPAIASIPIGEFRFADATDGAWIRLVGGGWVSSGVVELNGPCGSLPLVSAATSPEEAEAPPEPEPTTVNPLGQR